LNIDFSNATSLFIYLVPEGIKKIRPKLLELLETGVKIVTYGKHNLPFGSNNFDEVILMN
jgi:hypothetical protein